MPKSPSPPVAAYPGPGAASQIGLFAGLILGFVVSLFAFDFAGFHLGKFVGAWQVNRQIDRATNEAVLYKATGYHNLRDMIDDFEARHAEALAEARARAETTTPR